MKGYLNIPASKGFRKCRHCGSDPVIMLVEQGLYVVKCGGDDSHYQTTAGIIDMETWNLNNSDETAETAMS